MAKILVTGAGGRLGSLVCSALLAEGYLVRGLVKPGSTAVLPAGTERFEADLSKPVPPTAFQDVSHIVHCAGLVGDKPFNQLLLHNGFAVENLLKSCPSSVERIVLASSISVYGNHSGKVADEFFPLKPDTLYGKSKLVAEAAAFSFAYQHKSNISLLRFGMLYGNSFTEGYYQVLKLLLIGKMRIIGKGNNRIPLLHQADAISAIFAALDSNLPGCQVYNIVGAEQKTQKDLLSIAASKLGVPTPTKSIPVAIAYVAVKLKRLLFHLGLAEKPEFSEENIRQLSLDRAYSISKARQELGFEAKVKLEDGINEVVQSYLSSKEGSK